MPSSWSRFRYVKRETFDVWCCAALDEMKYTTIAIVAAKLAQGYPTHY